MSFKLIIFFTFLQIPFNELRDVKAIAEGGFGVVHRAKHPRWGAVVYKQLKSSIIRGGSKFVLETIRNSCSLCSFYFQIYNLEGNDIH